MKAKQFMKLPLHDAHWRKIRVRNELITVYIKKNPSKAKLLLEERMKWNNLLLSRLDSYKLTTFVSYQNVCYGMGFTKQDTHQTIVDIDPMFHYITTMYAK